MSDSLQSAATAARACSASPDNEPDRQAIAGETIVQRSFYLDRMEARSLQA